MPPFWLSIAVLSLVQGAVVSMPARAPSLELGRLRGGRWWGLVPPASVVAFVLVARAAESASAHALTYLALVAVPPLAVLALGWLMWGARPGWALVAAALFALAWADRGALPGDAAALALSALSCVTLGVLLASVTPPRWLRLGILAMAATDTALVVSDLLQRPNSTLNAAHPAAGLPQLQRAVFGTAVMGYGDLFIAGVLGGLLALTAGPRLQRRGALLTGVLALAFDLLFLFVDELPATVPPAVALVALMLADRATDARRRRSALAAAAGGPAPAPRRRAEAARSAPSR
jgi:hypothetical protein